NGEISSEEIDGAVAALKKLDKNTDGKLTFDELRPEMGEGGPRGFGGPGGPGGFGGPGGPDGGPGFGGAGAAMVERLMEFDKNGDGKLAKDELPTRLQTMFGTADKDGDEFLSKEELTAFAELRANRGGGGGRRGGGPNGEGGPRRDRRGPGNDVL
ncbi:MAG: hypothetical protein KDA92_17690, partial [Planctomycetales bacterium]|nr:hypothetical protein [Planctomycetales bacterium]